jgi:hypothetical protein
MNVLTPRDNDILPVFGPVVTAHPEFTQDNINAFSDAAHLSWKIVKAISSAGLYLRILCRENIYVNQVLNKRVGLIEYLADRTSPAPPWKNRILFS